MLQAFWAARGYWILGLFTFLIVAVVQTPLHFVWPYLKDQLGPLPLQVNSVTGTLWHGQAQLSDRMLGRIDGQWQLKPLALLTGTLASELEVKVGSARIEGQVAFDHQQVVQLEQVSAYIDADMLGPLLRRGQASLAGHFEVSQLNAQFDVTERKLSDASGRLVFSGGDVSFPVDGKPVKATLPMLIGNIATENSNTVVALTTTDNEILGQLYLQPDGWGGSRIRRRFLDVLGQQWPAKAEADTVIFEVSEKIL